MSTCLLLLHGILFLTSSLYNIAVLISLYSISSDIKSIVRMAIAGVLAFPLKPPELLIGEHITISILVAPKSIAALIGVISLTPPSVNNSPLIVIGVRNAGNAEEAITPSTKVSSF